MSQLNLISDDPDKCPKCGGPLVTVLRRRWCVKPYADGGCGTFWRKSGSRWEETPE